jgi:hypothetical protein
MSSYAVCSYNSETFVQGGVNCLFLLNVAFWGKAVGFYEINRTRPRLDLAGDY